LGFALQSIGDFDAAAVCYRKTLGLEPKNAVALYNLGNMYLAEGDLAEAVTSYRAALSQNPSMPRLIAILDMPCSDKGSLPTPCWRCARARVGLPAPGWRYPSARWSGR